MDRFNRKRFEKTGPPFEVDHFSRSERLEFWLNGSRPWDRGQEPMISGSVRFVFRSILGIISGRGSFRVVYRPAKFCSRFVHVSYTK